MKPMRTYDVIGSSGPAYGDQHVVYTARRLKDARIVAQAVYEAGGAFLRGVRHTFQVVEVFRCCGTVGRLMATYGRAPWRPEVSGRHPDDDGIRAGFLLLAGDANLIRRGGR